MPSVPSKRQRKSPGVLHIQNLFRASWPFYTSDLLLQGVHSLKLKCHPLPVGQYKTFCRQASALVVTTLSPTLQENQLKIYSCTGEFGSPKYNVENKRKPQGKDSRTLGKWRKRSHHYKRTLFFRSFIYSHVYWVHTTCQVPSQLQGIECTKADMFPVSLELTACRGRSIHQTRIQEN